MPSDERKNIQSSSVEEVARLLREADDTGVVPDTVSENAPNFLREIYDAWVTKGGQVSGKSRNSLRQLSELLKAAGSEVPSIQQKLAGQVRLTKGEVTSLITLFLNHWEYVGPPRATTATSESYKPFADINVQDICNILIGVLFSEGRKHIAVPPRGGKKAPGIAVRSSLEIFAEGYPGADALITVSTHRTIIAPTIAASMPRFRRAINYLWNIDKQHRHEPALLWVLDVGSRRFDDEEALAAFSNIESLAAAFRALAIFTDTDAEARWRWLEKHAVFVVGSLRSDEIDCWGKDEETQTNGWENKWPYISAQHVLLDALPPEWVGAAQLPILYGPHLEEFDKRAFTIFLRESGWEKSLKLEHSSRLRYFAYGPSPSEQTHRGSLLNQPAAISLELSSPERRYDEAFQLIYTAASYRTQKHISDSMAAEFPPLEALAHLRHLGFAVLRLNQFLRLTDHLSHQ